MRRPGFTLIELLVVVAIIALLIAILLPSLALARESARTTMCLANLKQMALATIMYSDEYKGTLPGPVHYLIYRDSYEKFRPHDQGWYEQQFPYLIRRQLGTQSGEDVEIVDKIADCPSVARTDRAQINNTEWYYQADARYIVNSCPNENLSTAPVFHGTDPPAYFGHLNYGAHRYINDLPKEQLPKKIEAIKEAAGEWMVADLWYWEVKKGRVNAVPAGTWPFLVRSGQKEVGSVTNQQGQPKIPTFAFHGTLKNFAADLPSGGKDLSPDNPRLWTGRTNASFFDGHGESVRGWRGTTQPLLKK
jgi:prepilin-type N-terminal cleavage/methylation domain-containing protein/prepilin-type processing-associated H-X9-DG protein